MKNATPKLRKKSFTIVEQACHEIHGFSKLYQELQDKVTLSGQTLSTLTNYARKLAHLSLHFGKLPQHISEREINRYLASLARKSTSPSLSDFKFTVYGLAYDDPYSPEQIQ
ncbi:MAG: phage integrase N-terminal SAM-like domain-containing protein [Lentimicrobiaceae bacterium]|nr:phage integrase N-terminal SAM-like domain-containing protein [Lentimicrobiaceae bacterium]